MLIADVDYEISPMPSATKNGNGVLGLVRIRGLLNVFQQMGRTTESEAASEKCTLPYAGCGSENVVEYVAGLF